MREGFFFMIQQIVKRDGRMAPFEIDKITNAIFGAAQASGGQDHDMAQELAEQVGRNELPKGGSEAATNCAHELLKELGRGALERLVKVHFANYKKI